MPREVLVEATASVFCLMPPWKSSQDKRRSCCQGIYSAVSSFECTGLATGAALTGDVGFFTGAAIPNRVAANIIRIGNWYRLSIYSSITVLDVENYRCFNG